MNKMYLRLLIVTLFFYCSALANPTGNLKVSVDMESAEAICHALTLKKTDSAALAAIANLHGNKMLIQKVKGYSGYGEDVFIKTLKEIIETGTIKNEDPYNWKYVKERLQGILSLINYLKTNKDAFVADVTNIIAPYVPDTLHADARACFLVGGGALGFTFGNDPTLNVALQKVGDDVEGLKYLVAHELYHTIQDIGQHSRVYTKDTTAPYNVQAAYFQLYNLWSEGTANFVGDMAKVKRPKSFTEEQQKEYNKNMDRKAQNFQLFDALLYKQYYDSTTDYEAIYNISFTTAFDETGYFTGYDMAKKLVQYYSDTAISGLIIADPIRFTANYIALYKAHEDDKSFKRFSKSFEVIVDKLMAWENKL